MVHEKEGVGFKVLVNCGSEVLSEVAFDVSVDCSATEGQNGHFPRFQNLLLAVELIDDQKGEGVGGEGERVVVGRFNGFAVK
jgi:hypothetical protein